METSDSSRVRRTTRGSHAFLETVRIQAFPAERHAGDERSRVLAGPGAVGRGRRIFLLEHLHADRDHEVSKSSFACC